MANPLSPEQVITLAQQGLARATTHDERLKYTRALVKARKAARKIKSSLITKANRLRERENKKTKARKANKVARKSRKRT